LCEFWAGSHVELMKKIPEGAYSQLIHLQETRQAGAEFSSVDPDIVLTNGIGSSRSINSRPRSQSISRRSTSKGSSSFGHSGRHSFPAPLGLPDPMELNGSPADVEETVDKTSRAPLGRLLYLNKPEALVLALGSITAAMHGVIFPIYGTLISTAIKVFYEPPAELLKDSRFWASMFVALGACAFVLIPVEYFLFGLAGGKLVERVRSLTFQSIMRQEISWFDKPEHSRCVGFIYLFILKTIYFAVILRNISPAGLFHFLLFQWINWCKTINRCHER
jgi:ATP-binding cassette, subfamily B (MDR/TAP), member 1